MDELVMGWQWLAEQRRLQDRDVKYERWVFRDDEGLFWDDDDNVTEEPEVLPVDWWLNICDELMPFDLGNESEI